MCPNRPDEGPCSSLNLTSRRICFLGQLVQEGKERLRLADEKPHVGQELDHTHRNTLGLGRTNNRTYREAPAKEMTGLRHDEVGLKVFRVKGRSVEIGKCQPVGRVG